MYVTLNEENSYIKLLETVTYVNAIVALLLLYVVNGVGFFKVVRETSVRNGRGRVGNRRCLDKGLGYQNVKDLSVSLFWYDIYQKTPVKRK